MSEYGAIYNELRVKQEFSNPFGALIRRDIPAKIAMIPELDSNIYAVRGRHGAGCWSATLWIAAYDKRITISAQEGAYIVYLVNKDTKELYLSLGLAASQDIPMPVRMKSSRPDVRKFVVMLVRPTSCLTGQSALALNL